MFPGSSESQSPLVHFATSICQVWVERSTVSKLSPRDCREKTMRRTRTISVLFKQTNFLHKVPHPAPLRPALTAMRTNMSTVANPSRDDVIRILRTCQAVCIDVDSTVIPEEGIDELAAFKGVGDQVAQWTKQAMNGETLFQDALQARLNLIQPSKADVIRYLQERDQSSVPRLTPGISDLVDKLHRKGKIVYLISGGFRQMVEPVADLLGVPVHRIFANRLLFDEASGAYAGFDDQEPTSRDGGKAAVLQQLFNAHGYEPIVVIGDGVTDMQARPPAQLFIGYGGVVQREPVMEGADLYVTDLQEVTALLDA